MNYRHAYHAGNFADVLKHAALVAVLHHLRKKESAFAVIDAHAGRGLYDLEGPEAKKTREADEGIGRLLKLTEMPPLLASYCAIVRGFGSHRYPGSPLIAAKLLRGQDRLVAIEKHPDECEALRAAIAGVKRARVVNGDFKSELKRLLPPPERRGVILIDPPYEADDEFVQAARAIVDAYRRFATGIYLFWYPAKHRPSVDAAAGELLTAGIDALLRVELDVAAPVARDPERAPPMSSTGLLIVNPPFGFAEEMNVALPFLVKHLGRGNDAQFRVEQLAGET